MKSFGLSFLAVAVLALAAHINAVPLENEINSNDSNEDSFFQLKTIANCAEEGGIAGVMNCAAMRALKSLQYIAKQPSLEIVPGITLNSDNSNVQRSGKSLSDEELPKDPQEKANKLYSLILDNAASVVSGRTLKISMPENVSESVSRALEEGALDFLPGRKKKKGSMIPSYILGIGAKMLAVVPVVMGGLALLTTKALIVAKIALVLSGIVFFQYLGNKGSTIFSGITGNSNGYGGAASSGGYGGGAHGFSTGYGSGSYNPSTWTTNSLGGAGGAGAGAGGSYARSIDVAEEAQKMAYSASAKKQN